MPRTWTDKQLAVMRWQTTPQPMRKQKNLAELARDLGIDRTTIYDWFQLPEWESAKQKVSFQTMLNLTPDFLNSLSIQLLLGNDKAHQVYFRYIWPVLAAAKEQGLLDDVQPHTAMSANMLQQRHDKAVEMFASFPQEQRDAVLGFLSAVGEIADVNGRAEIVPDIPPVVDYEQGQEELNDALFSYSKNYKHRRAKEPGKVLSLPERKAARTFKLTEDDTDQEPDDD